MTEREQLIAELEKISWRGLGEHAHAVMQQAIAALSAPDLRPWAEHKADCAITIVAELLGDNAHAYDPFPRECTCDLDAALKAHDALPRP